MELKLEHILLSAIDFQKSIDFYKKLGFYVAQKWEKPGKSKIAELEHKKSSIMIELVSYDDPNIHSPPNDVKSDTKITGYRHISFSSKDIEEDKKKLEDIGIAQNIEIKYSSRVNANYLFIRDPDGNYIEFIQRKVK